MSTIIPKNPILYGMYRFFPPSVYGPAPQNPAPMNLHGQVDRDRVRSLADQIVTVFLNSLPSNYVSQTKGPYYVQQFQAAAEELARVQVLLNDAYEDTDYDFTRPEVLFQFLATLVFPDAGVEGLPEINGDLTYREFLKRMVALLLQGSRAVTLVQGIEALTDVNVSLLQKFRYLDDPNVLWTMADQFTFEVDVSKFNRTGPTTAISVTSHYHTVTVNVTGDGVTGEGVYASGSGPAHTHTITDFVVQEGNGDGQASHTHDLISAFPDLPVTLQRNVGLVLQALDPASTLYEYRNLFRENLKGILTDELTHVGLEAYYYEDFRRDWSGIQAITGTHGVVGADRYLFQDPTLSFRSVRVGSELVVPVVPTPSPSSRLPRENRYRVRAVLSFPYGDDPVPRAYTTSPTGLSGSVTVADGAFTDATVNFALCQEGETLTVASGPNAGTYLLETLLGLNGGPLGGAGLGPSTSVRPAPTFLRVSPRIVTAGTSIAYSVAVDPLGVQVPRTVANEDVSLQFVGDGVTTFSTLTTTYGPLVKGWGDATPASIDDVVVEYDGAPVAVDAVNPYTGEITLTSAITSFAPGAHTVTVSYQWFSAPVTGMKGLNTKGLTLNSWSLRRGRNTTSPSYTGYGGGIAMSRFPMGVTLGRFSRRAPVLRIAHRFIGFEKGYTASLNSPTTLLLNQSPQRVSVPYAVADVAPQNFRYEGDVFPDTPWVSVGEVQGSVNDGFYSLTDSSTAAMAYWKRDFPLPTSTSVTMAARIQVDAYEPDGVFTGIGFGFHNNQRLFFAGALSVTNPVTGTALRHLGILLRPGRLSELSSWTVGPNAFGAVLKPESGATQGTLTVPTSTLPTLLSTGDKFQILDGTQTGIYTIEDLYHSSTGDTILMVSPMFPANPELYGNRDVTMYFDTGWDDGMCTWRLYANTRSQSVSLVFGGKSGSTTGVGSGTVASPAYLGPDVLPEGYGRALWGSLDRGATNRTTWDFVRCASTPDGAYTYARETVVDAAISPEDRDWYLRTPFGVSTSFGGTTVINSTPADEALGTYYGYGYTDPFLNGRRVAAFDARIVVERDTAGVGGATMSLRDTHREARLATILFRDDGVLGKVIQRLDTLSLVGSVPYYLQGWDGDIGELAYPNGPEMFLTGDGGAWGLYRTLTPNFSPCVGRFLEFRLRVTDYTLGTLSSTGLVFAANFGTIAAYMEFRAGNLVMCTAPGAGAIAMVGIPWEDGQDRTYRLEYNAGLGTVDITVDNTLQASTAVGSYNPTTLPGSVEVLAYDTGGTFRAALSSLCYGGTLETITGLHRTIGLYRGGDEGDLNNWALVRTDGLDIPNSAPGSVITDMDWTASCWVRVFLDPTYGASFIRPDLNPPPGYTGDFATQSMNPSAGWVSLPYADLPRVTPTENFGTVSFGALNPSGSVISVWDDVRYRVFTNTSVDYTAPQGMVLNRWNVVNSGEFLKDTTPQEVVVSSVTPTRVSLRPCQIFANRVFAVRVDGMTLPANLWRFNRDSQEITLTVGVPSRGYPVNVVFAPGKPVTVTYLQEQPLEESQTILNEGTPPIQMSQTGTFTVSTVSGDGGVTPAFPPAVPADLDYFLRDQYLVRSFENTEMYENLEFFQLDNGGAPGRITSYQDGTGLGEGVRDVSLSGNVLRDSYAGMGAPGRGRGPGVYPLSLMASGGTFEGGELGTYRFTDLVVTGGGSYEVTRPFSGSVPTTTEAVPPMMYAVSPSEGAVRGTDTGAINRETLFVLHELPAPGTVTVWTGGSIRQTWG
jgi:hypothetical protein